MALTQHDHVKSNFAFVVFCALITGIKSSELRLIGTDTQTHHLGVPLRYNTGLSN